MKKIKQRVCQLLVIISCFLLYIPSKVFGKKYKDYWLLSERGNEARDNAYSFYRFLKKEHPEIKVKFLITKNSPDIAKINSDDVVELRSIEHYFVYFNAKQLISTHIEGYSPEFRLFTKIGKKFFLKPVGNKIFLQHGIIKDYSPGLHVNKVDLDIFICGAKREYDYLIETLEHGEKVMKLTGLARYDYLKNLNKNYILVMPTWRSNLYYESLDSFKTSAFFESWNSFLQSRELIELVEKYDLNVIFYPHYEIQRFISCFKSFSDRIIIATSDQYDVQKLLCESKCLITDYSSVFFDFAYLRKNEIFYQFDFEDFRKFHYNEGYFNYERDSFGKVVYNQQDLLDELYSIVKRDFTVDESYISKINDFFLPIDGKNCSRIYDCIIKLDGSDE